MNTFYRVRQVILLLADVSILFFALYISLTIRTTHPPTIEQYFNHIPFFILFIFWIVINYINGLYDFRGFASDTPLPRRITETAVFSIIIGITFFYIYPSSTVQPKTLLILTATLSYLGIFLLRLKPKLLQDKDILTTPLLFVGWNNDTQEIYNSLKNQKQYGLQPTAVLKIENNAEIAKTIMETYNVDQKIRSIVSNHNIRIVVVTPEAMKDTGITSELYQLLFWGVKIVDSITLFEHTTGSLPTSSFTEGWFLRHIGKDNQYIHQKWQRSLDIISAIIIGSIAIILFPFITVGIKITSRGPIFFKQKRIGKNNVPFVLYKFRSMYTLSSDGSAETNGFEFSKKGDVRITHFGKFIRKFRIDELPQAINLLRGEISLIGPRPERPEIVEELTKIMPYYPLRHITKPGLTGWAVLHQNYTDNMETSLEKLRYDLYYIKNKSILLDVSIILKTIRLLIRAMGQ